MRALLVAALVFGIGLMAIPLTVAETGDSPSTASSHPYIHCLYEVPSGSDVSVGVNCEQCSYTVGTTCTDWDHYYRVACLFVAGQAFCTI